MTRIYIIRHAEAEGNLFHRAHGWFDGHITATGMEQIAALEKRFADIHVDTAYASELTRTQITAQAVVAPKGLKLRIEPGLNEIRMGVYEDVTLGDLIYHHPEERVNFGTYSRKWAPEGGDTFAQAAERGERYRGQLAAYAYALETLSGKPVVARLLCFLYPNVVVELGGEPGIL